jgi:MoaA/NifB/PqqE/SkfB family radical SAM enzyme
MRAFDIMKDRGVGFVVLFGGEPTLRDDLPYMVEYLNDIEMPHTIITNGIRMNKDEKYFNRIIEAKPYGISTSVNALKAEDSFHDNKKSEVGAELLLKLLDALPKCDLVANMAVTRKNIHALPRLVEHFTKKGIWSILSFFHVAPVNESLYWWYRGAINDSSAELVFQDTAGDIELVNNASKYFRRNHHRLKLHNQKDYFEAWTLYGVKQNWHCHEWVCPAVNPDGSLMACIDRPLTKPWSIFDLGKKKPEIDLQIYESFKKTIDDCDRGCFWDHMWETNKYASENRAEEGKRNFAHEK